MLVVFFFPISPAILPTAGGTAHAYSSEECGRSGVSTGVVHPSGGLLRQVARTQHTRVKKKEPIMHPSSSVAVWWYHTKHRRLLLVFTVLVALLALFALLRLVGSLSSGTLMAPGPQTTPP